MAKKRGKTKDNAISKKPAKKGKKAKAAIKAEKPVETAPMPVKDALKELEIMTEKSKEIGSIEKKEDAIEKKESAIIAEEKKIEKETEKVEKMEKDIRKEVTSKPLKNFTIKDLSKGIIGAFIGVVAHFAFIYGKAIAKDISIARASILMIFSYVLIIILMYETGYRQIKEKRLLGILPKRATAIYITSIIMIPVIFFMFNQIDLSSPVELFKEIAVTSVLASVGAGTADLIGRD